MIVWFMYGLRQSVSAAREGANTHSTTIIMWLLNFGLILRGKLSLPHSPTCRRCSRHACKADMLCLARQQRPRSVGEREHLPVVA